MDRLLRATLASVERGEPSPELLAKLGEPEPHKAAAALRVAAAHADLAPTLASWLPAVLRTARPGFSAQCLADLADRYRSTHRQPLELARLPSLPLVLGSSDFLARLLLRHPGWVAQLEGEIPAAPPPTAIEPDWTAIRIAKYQGLLRIAARDLAGRAFRDGLGELSALADRCLSAGLSCAAAQVGLAPPALLALGKLGGQELNFASDVDLIFLYEPPPSGLDPAQHHAFAKLIQSFKNHLEAASEDGFGYRIDLDLRPQGRQGALINTTDAALLYYESLGADWERQMLIRLRHVAGPPAVAASFQRALVPFVYRQLISPSTIAAIRAMKLRIESERRSAGSDLEVELKEGPGGIRDIEFLTQAFQLLFGGRNPELRTGNVMTALEALEQLRLLPAAVTRSLVAAYLWLRRAEHAVQLVEERQTHRFPRDGAAQIGLARRMGYLDEEGASARSRLLEDWTHVRAEVRAHFNALILEAPGDAGA